LSGVVVGKTHQTASALAGDLKLAGAAADVAGHHDDAKCATDLA
jgi:hypothetical protein